MSMIRAAIAAALVASVAAASAAAITGSRPDGAAHPYVGALVVDGAVVCSGVLVAPRAFATAGHCTASIAAGAAVGVTFDAHVDEASWSLHRGTPHTHPAYANGADLGLILLDAPPAVAPASLPAEGLVASLAGGVTSVGYGLHLAGDGRLAYDGTRRQADSAILQVKKALLRIDTASGGPCHGDSGGPQLRGDTVVSVTSAGSNDCSGKAEGYRLDTPAARAFLGRFVTLP